MSEEKCKHGKDAWWCVICRYGKSGHRHESRDEENPKDLVDELRNTSNYRKLKEFYIDE